MPTETRNARRKRLVEVKHRKAQTQRRKARSRRDGVGETEPEAEANLPPHVKASDLLEAVIPTTENIDNLSDGYTGVSLSTPKALGFQSCRHDKSPITAHNLFNYRTLDQTKREIRLLTIQANAEDDDICVNLEHTSLDEADDTYDAVSYTWGPEMPQYPIWIQGEPLMLRENIWRFLRHLSKRSIKTKRLWIDSICINQNDNTEKSWQVSMMGNTFENASRVYIWLGEASELSSVGTACAHHRNTAKRYRGILAFLRDEHRGDDVKADCMRIVLNDYWDRLWVIQEVVNARKALMILGSELCDVQLVYDLRGCDLGRYHESKGRNIDVQPCDFARYADILYQFHLTDTRSVGRRFSERVELHYKQRCSDKRDKIYGILGVSNSANLPSVDYTCSIQNLFVQSLECFMGESHEETRDNQWVELQSVEALVRSLEVNSDMFRNSHTWPMEADTHTSLTRKFNLRLTVSEVVVSCGTQCSDTGPESGTSPTEGFVICHHPNHGTSEKFTFLHSIGDHTLWEDTVLPQGALLSCHIDRYSFSSLQEPVLILGWNAEYRIEIHAFGYQKFSPSTHRHNQSWLTSQLPSSVKEPWETVLNAQIQWGPPGFPPRSSSLQDKQYILLPCSALELVELIELNEITPVERAHLESMVLSALEVGTDERFACSAVTISSALHLARRKW